MTATDEIGTQSERRSKNQEVSVVSVDCHVGVSVYVLRALVRNITFA